MTYNVAQYLFLSPEVQLLRAESCDEEAYVALYQKYKDRSFSFPKRLVIINSIKSRAFYLHLWVGVRNR